jgi:hypothetical protein
MIPKVEIPNSLLDIDKLQNMLHMLITSFNLIFVSFVCSYTEMNLNISTDVSVDNRVQFYTFITYQVSRTKNLLMYTMEINLISAVTNNIGVLLVTLN